MTSITSPIPLPQFWRDVEPGSLLVEPGCTRYIIARSFHRELIFRETQEELFIDFRFLFLDGPSSELFCHTFRVVAAGMVRQSLRVVFHPS